MMYDIIVFKTSVFVRPHENGNLAFSKISTPGPFFKSRVIGAQNLRLRVDGRLKLSVFTRIGMDGVLILALEELAISCSS